MIIAQFPFNGHLHGHAISGYAIDSGCSRPMSELVAGFILPVKLSLAD
jgi:hypothetical protein